MFVRASCRKDNFTPEGFCRRNRGRAGYTPVASDVVCFVSAPADDVGQHEARPASCAAAAAAIRDAAPLPSPVSRRSQRRSAAELPAARRPGD